MSKVTTKFTREIISLAQAVTAARSPPSAATLAASRTTKPLGHGRTAAVHNTHRSLLECLSHLLGDGHSATEFVSQVDTNHGFPFLSQAVEQGQEVTHGRGRRGGQVFVLPQSAVELGRRHVHPIAEDLLAEGHQQGMTVIEYRSTNSGGRLATLSVTTATLLMITLSCFSLVDQPAIDELALVRCGSPDTDGMRQEP